ncbi:MAG TPA: ribonuclease P protein subunit [Nitrosopumilaceae archaeon]|nr:ribonuclease P protein subunit [Nitrosopumilaceae archaeon]
MITEENLVTHELIGLMTSIGYSSNPQLVSTQGKIMDETKSMLILNTRNGFKMIPKKFNTWKFYVNEQEVTLNGSFIAKRSYDRLVTKI